jgi:hypothetical protein
VRTDPASLSDAVTRIAEIHGQIAKGEVYRGWRAAPVALSGIVGLAGAWLQPGRLADDPLKFVVYWSGIAAVAATVGTSEILYSLLRGPVSDDEQDWPGHRTSFERRQTRRVVAQFLGPVAVAVLVTGIFVRLGAALVALLPGLWALLYGLAVFSARPYLPRPSGVVALYYIACGTLLLWGAEAAIVRSPWAVGGVFGVGQLVAAGLIYWNLEREKAS